MNSIIYVITYWRYATVWISDNFFVSYPHVNNQWLISLTCPTKSSRPQFIWQSVNAAADQTGAVTRLLAHCWVACIAGGFICWKTELQKNYVLDELLSHLKILKIQSIHCFSIQTLTDAIIHHRKLTVLGYEKAHTLYNITSNAGKHEVLDG